jgi:hypothetical protein
MPHDQRRTDAFCRTIIANSEPLSEREVAALMGKPGVVVHAMVCHDDACATMVTGRGGDCSCRPVMRYFRPRREAAEDPPC